MFIIINNFSFNINSYNLFLTLNIEQIIPSETDKNSSAEKVLWGITYI